LQVGINEKTVTDWCSFLRDVCSRDLLANRYQLGGPGHIVAIDESLVAKRKPGNAQGRPVPVQWVFGAVDIQTKEFFIQLVDARDAQTLIPVIQANILPGTEIWSDQWPAYNGLATVGYVHNFTRLLIIPLTM
jgi:ISXO2-like transposase domain